ncbi:MAG: zinc-ribbon domain-containing protein [Deltaproteobacteria bacterium]|nr:zinc-ribbon domain-containing protein [Deltaproteobacteria bacterium]MCL5276736.1 zinc-ribbon domain-containing protein [Deltaproteobacteria bacterium]
MVVVCPKCLTKYGIAEGKLSGDSARLRCPKCGEVFLLKRKKAPPNDAGRAGEAPPLPAVVAGKKVLVAHPSASMRDTIGDLLKEGGFAPVFAKNGIEAISIMGDIHPDVVVVDVALPDIFGFEFPEIIKKDRRLSGIKVILIASIYDKTRYKRMPQSLHGADDFIEKHHIRGSLIPKINSLFGRQEEGKAQPVQATISVGQTTAPHVIEEGAKGLKEEGPVQTAARARDVEKAKRLARIIVSDIALYNQELLEQGIRQGTIEEAVQNDLDEGRRLFNKRVPEDVRKQGDFLLESLNELIEKKKRELGIVQ